MKLLTIIQTVDANTQAYDACALLAEHWQAIVQATPHSDMWFYEISELGQSILFLIGA